MRYSIHINILKTNDNIVFYDENKAVVIKNCNLPKLKEFLNYFEIIRNEEEVIEFISKKNMQEVWRIMDENNFIKQLKPTNLDFRHITIISKRIIAKKIGQFICSVNADVDISYQYINEKGTIRKIEILENDLVILYLTDLNKWGCNLLEKYDDYKINKLLIAFHFNDVLYFAFLAPPITACPRCLVEALRRNSELFNFISLQNGKILNSTINELIEQEMIPVMLANFYSHLITMVDDNINPAIVGNLNTYNLKKGSYEVDFIFRSDNCNCLEIDNLEFSSLIGKKIGLIRNINVVVLDQSFPPCVFLKAKLPYLNENVGALDFTWQSAYERTIGEFVERYCWRNFKKGIVYMSWDKIPIDERLPIDYFNGFADEQYKKLDEIHKLISSEEIAWMKGRCVLDDTERFIPAEFIIGAHSLNKTPIHIVSSTGVAAGMDGYEKVLHRAILEAIERDTVTRNYFLKDSFFALHDDDILKNYNVSRCIDYGLIPKFYYIPNKYCLPVIMCALVPTDESDRVISYGYACEDNSYTCIIKSLKEALLMREAVKKDLSKNGKLSRFNNSLRGESTSLLENINISGKINLDFLLNMSPNKKLMQELLKETFFVDITLDNIKKMKYLVLSVWNPRLLDFAWNRQYIPLKKFGKNIMELNKGALAY